MPMEASAIFWSQPQDKIGTICRKNKTVAEAVSASCQIDRFIKTVSNANRLKTEWLATWIK